MSTMETEGQQQQTEDVSFSKNIKKDIIIQIQFSRQGRNHELRIAIAKKPSQMKQIYWSLTIKVNQNFIGIKLAFTNLKNVHFPI
jgi:stress response protein SCP2